MLDVLHWLPVWQRIQYRVVSLVWLWQLGLAPAYLRDQLEEVTRATTLLYAASVWWGFASEGDRGRVERFIGRLRRSGYLPKEAPTAADMVDEAEARLFRSVRGDSRHVLKSICPLQQFTST